MISVKKLLRNKKRRAEQKSALNPSIFRPKYKMPETLYSRTWNEARAKLEPIQIIAQDIDTYTVRTQYKTYIYPREGRIRAWLESREWLLRLAKYNIRSSKLAYIDYVLKDRYECFNEESRQWVNPEFQKAWLHKISRKLPVIGNFITPTQEEEKKVILSTWPYGEHPEFYEMFPHLKPYQEKYDKYKANGYKGPHGFTQHQLRYILAYFLVYCDKVKIEYNKNQLTSIMKCYRWKAYQEIRRVKNGGSYFTEEEFRLGVMLLLYIYNLTGVTCLLAFFTCLSIYSDENNVLPVKILLRE